MYRVSITVEGRDVTLHGFRDYDSLLEATEAFARQMVTEVKVLVQRGVDPDCGGKWQVAMSSHKGETTLCLEVVHETV